MMRALDRKLLRELWRLRGQILAIALVIGSGVATYVIAHSTIDSLTATQTAFYRDGRFADVFASLRRAPLAVVARAAQIPGVRQADARVTSSALIDLPDFPDPVSALVLSLPDPAAGLNKLYLRSGRLPERDDEVTVNEAFAEAHKLRPGARIAATIHGHRHTLTLTGVVLSPEFVYLIRFGDVFPDYKRFGVLWMTIAPLAAAQGMDGAFNDLVLSLEQGASEPAVIEALDRLLQPWGGSGAIGRRDQISHRYLSDEIRQLEAQAEVVPIVFLGVAAFLLNVVLSRLIAQERTQIAVLKAFGYSNGAISLHYSKLVGLIVLLGALIGVLAGAYLGSGLASMYSRFFRYPFLHYVLRPEIILIAILISSVAAAAGTLFAVARAARLPPAQGMRPEPPPHFRRSLLHWRPFRALLSPPDRMIARGMARRPVKSALTVLGIALAVATLTVGGFMGDAIDQILEVQFNNAYRADLTVRFTELTSHSVLHDLQHLPGVRQIEPLRFAAIRLRSEQQARRLAALGFVSQPVLNRLLGNDYRTVAIPQQGLLLTDYLAKKLGVEPGDSIHVEALQGRQHSGMLPIVGVTRDMTGYGAYMHIDTLNRWLGDGDGISAALLQVDADQLNALYDQIKKMPNVAGVTNRRVALKSFAETMGQNMLIFSFVNLALASSIAVGVVYNSMRVALSERAHEFASLRVLGYTWGETAYVLIGEIGLLTLIAIPLGGWLGYQFCAYLAERLGSDLYRIDVVLSPQTYGYAALVITVTAVLSALIMIRHIQRLSLASALKIPQ